MYACVQAVRTQLFGHVRAAVRSQLLQGRPAFAAALLAVRRLAEGIGRIQMCSLRAGHVYELAEFVDLQARHVLK